MKIPLRWLRDYVDITLPEAALIERLTLAGLEVGGTKVIGLPIPDGVRVKAEDKGPVWDRDKIFVAEILSIGKHPDADRLKLPVVTWGPGAEKTLVTGAPNVEVGQTNIKVVLALSGSKLFDGHSEERVIKELKPSKIRGIPSDAMVCSNLELGIAEDHEGIILLESDAPVGMPLADFMGDVVLEADVLPNMARCLSMIGVAREVAALTGQKVKLPTNDLAANGPSIDGQVTVSTADVSLCPRYAGFVIRDVTIGPSPGWMQRRLLYSGMRPISNIVDVTNFVMLEWGQPLHAFDYDVLVKRAGGKTPAITVRPAKAGEKLETLDKQVRELTPEHLVIADAAGPIALAGVMGGLETEVTATTKNILLESANFDGVSIRRTFHHFGLPSEASQRFSRGLHPETVMPAGRRAAELMRLYAGGTVAAGVVDCYPAPRAPRVVELKMADVRRTLGMWELPEADAIRILTSLEFEVTASEGILTAVVPPHRVDIQDGPADLIEEIARIHGYDRMPATLLSDRLPRQKTNEDIVFEEKIRDVLALCGLQEAICYSLTTPEREAPLVGEGVDYVRLKNPISAERSVMRRSVLASLLEVAANNLRNMTDLRMFEIGTSFIPTKDPLPEERRQLAIVMTGARQPGFWNDEKAPAKSLDFFDLKGVVEGLVNDLHLVRPHYKRLPELHEGYPWRFLHPGKSATLFAGAGPEGADPIGDFGELHPSVAEKLGLGERTILVGQFDLSDLMAARPPRFGYVPVPRFPAALRDIAVVVDESAPAEQVVAEIKAAGGGLLRDARLFDVYKGAGIPEGKKSLAFALAYQAEDRTLTDKEIDKAHKKIEDRLKHVLKALIRGKDVS